MNRADPIAIPVRPRWSAMSGVERVVLGSLLLAGLAVSAYLVPFWRELPELSHGWFALPCATALLWQSRRETNLIANWTPGAALAIEWALFVTGGLIACVAALAALAQGPWDPLESTCRHASLSIL